MAYDEPLRPQYHFTPPGNWMNDPNGLVRFAGEWHLFYQHNPFGRRWGHMHWGHAVSRDLLRWRHLPIALFEEERPDQNVTMFSGGVVVDRQNTSGFARRGQTALVATYTASRRWFLGSGPSAATERNDSSSSTREASVQTIDIAFSVDQGRTWEKYEHNPVLNTGERKHGDPVVVRLEKEGLWVMAAINGLTAPPFEEEPRVLFYGSPDLKRWHKLGEFAGQGSCSSTWECPEIMQVHVEGGKHSRWVLKVDQMEYGQYFVGDFDGRSFANDNPPETILRVDHGNFYAAQSWRGVSASDGRVLWIGWIREKESERPWTGVMSVPRELSLRQTDDGLRLVQRPLRELRTLRGEPTTVRDLDLTSGATAAEPRARGDSLEVDLVLEVDSGRAGLVADPEDGGEPLRIGFDRERSAVFVEGVEEGAPAGTAEAPGGLLRLQVLLDRSVLEVYAAEGQTVLTATTYRSGRFALRFFCEGEARVHEATFWPLASIWQ